MTLFDNERWLVYTVLARSRNACRLDKSMAAAVQCDALNKIIVREFSDLESSPDHDE